MKTNNNKKQKIWLIKIYIILNTNTNHTVTNGNQTCWWMSPLTEVKFTYSRHAPYNSQRPMQWSMVIQYYFQKLQFGGFRLYLPYRIIHHTFWKLTTLETQLNNKIQHTSKKNKKYKSIFFYLFFPPPTTMQSRCSSNTTTTTTFSTYTPFYPLLITPTTQGPHIPH